MLLVERHRIVTYEDVGLVEPCPHGAHECFVSVFPFGGEHDLLVAVPASGCADGAWPFEHVVCVDSASDGVFPAAEVPKLSLNRKSPVLDFRPAGDALDVEGEDSDVFKCFLLDARFYLQNHLRPLSGHVLPPCEYLCVVGVLSLSRHHSVPLRGASASTL